MRFYPNFCDAVKLSRVTLRHYSQMMKSAKLRQLDAETDIHLTAWKNREIGATNKKGQYIYTHFNDFYDVEKRKREILGIKQDSLFDDPERKKLLLLANHGKEGLNG